VLSKIKGENNLQRELIPKKHRKKLWFGRRYHFTGFFIIMSNIIAGKTVTQKFQHTITLGLPEQHLSLV
jgi:hypothetical protein